MVGGLEGAGMKKAPYPQKQGTRGCASCGTTQVGAMRPLKALTRQTSGDFPARPHGSIRRAAHAPFPPPGALFAALSAGTFPNLRFPDLIDILCPFSFFVKCSKNFARFFETLSQPRDTNGGQSAKHSKNGLRDSRFPAAAPPYNVATAYR